MAFSNPIKEEGIKEAVAIKEEGEGIKTPLKEEAALLASTIPTINPTWEEPGALDVKKRS